MEAVAVRATAAEGVADLEGAKEKVAVAVQGLAGAMVGWVVRAMGGGGVRGSGVAGGLVAAAVCRKHATMI